MTAPEIIAIGCIAGPVLYALRMRSWRRLLISSGVAFGLAFTLLYSDRKRTPPCVAAVPPASTLPVPAPAPDRADGGEMLRPVEEHSSMIAAPTESEAHEAWESRKGYP